MAAASAMNGGDLLDVKKLLSSSERDFLVRNNGDKVNIEELRGKKVGLYFSASWCGPCQQFTPVLVDIYRELLPNGDLEIVFVSADRNGKSFTQYFSKMPWLAIPFSDSQTRDHLDQVFNVDGIPHLVFIDENGEVLTDDGYGVIEEYGVEAYPFTPEKIKEIKEVEEATKRDQTFKSLLVNSTRDFVLSSDGKRVPISQFEGKTVGLYFTESSDNESIDFTAKLIDIYEKLKAKGENFEVVTIPLDEEEESLEKCYEGVPWYSLPINDKSCDKLATYFELQILPTLVIIGPDGKTLYPNVAEAIEEHGILAFPFTPENFAELAAIEKAREEAQTLESILVSGDLDFVIGKEGIKIPVADLVGRNILIYFSAHWCPPCRAFLPKLIEAYHKIKAKDSAFEVIFISWDEDETSFNEFFSTMPWLALPFGDPRKAFLSRKFKVSGIPTLIAIGPDGRTVTKEARELITVHGADAYPFTEERVKEIEAKLEEVAKGWPEKINHKLHEHELDLARCHGYFCDGWDEEGNLWSYHCKECNFDLDPKCALEAEKDDKNGDVREEEKPKGWICEGDVYRKA